MDQRGSIRIDSTHNCRAIFDCSPFPRCYVFKLYPYADVCVEEERLESLPEAWLMKMVRRESERAMLSKTEKTLIGRELKVGTDGVLRKRKGTRFGRV